MVKIAIANLQRRLAFDESRLRRMIRRLLKHKRGEVGIAVVGSRRMTALNKKYLGRHGETDVLSFDLSSNKGRIEGEIVVSAPKAVCGAKWNGGDAESELALYVAHGVLHLLGMNDDTQEGARQMHRRALKILKNTGYRNVR